MTYWYHKLEKKITELNTLEVRATPQGYE